MKVKILKNIVVVTPTIGSKKLVDAVNSVKNQDYKNVQHLLVIDGVEHLHLVNNVIDNISTYPNLNFMTLPYNVGKNGFYGHRVYAAISHLLNCDYIAFLDEDNWYDENHISSLVDLIESDQSYDFVYSLRKIWNNDKSKNVDDCCESLGQWPVWVAPQDQILSPNTLVDTSSYLFKINFLINHGHIWHHGWGADRRFFQYATTYPGGPKAISNGTWKHTLNYRLDGNPNSVNMEFFEQGNKKMKEYYGEYPWLTQQ